MPLKTGLTLVLELDYDDDTYYQMQDNHPLWQDTSEYVSLCLEKIEEILGIDDDTITIHLAFEPTPSYIEAFFDGYDLLIGDEALELTGATRRWLANQEITKFWFRVE